jgi:replicative DNA helicase
MRSQVARAHAEVEILGERLKKARRSAVDAAPQDRGKRLAEAEDLAETLATAERKAPSFPRLVADDVTPEALGLLLQQQGGRMAVISAEGGELFEIIGGRYSQNTRPNLSVFLNAHSGDPIRVDRMKREPVFVEHPALTICLAVQPEVIRGLTSKSNSVLRGRGLLGRFLYVIPRSPLGTRNPASAAVPPPALAAYAATVERLLELPVANGEAHLSEDATTAWLCFAADLEPRLAEHGELGHLGDWAGKLAGAVARLAGILHAAEWADKADPWAIPIDVTSMERAIRLSHYFIAHAKLAFGLMGVDADIERAMRIWRWIRDAGLTEVGRKDLWQQFKGGTVRKADELDALLSILTTHHYLRRRPVPQDEHGKPGRKASIYDVNPEALT